MKEGKEEEKGVRRGREDGRGGWKVKGRGGEGKGEGKREGE